MAKYLRLFNTHENYKTELQSGKLELSNVSLISGEKSIQYKRNSPNILKCTYEISQQDFEDNTELVSSFGGMPLMINADSYLHGYKINGEEVIFDPLTKLDLGGGIIEYEYLDNKYIPKSNYRIKFSEKITEFLILLDDNSDIDNIINNYYISIGILDGNDNILEDEWMCQTLNEAVYQNQLLILDDDNNLLQLSSAYLSVLEYMEEMIPGGSMVLSLVDQPYVDSGGQTIPSINTKIQKYFTSGGIGNITVADPGKYTLEYDFNYNYSEIQDIVFNIYGIASEAISHLITRFDSSKLLPIPGLNYIIPTNLFGGNNNLNKLILENITKINPHAIYSCSNLTKLTIPNSVIEIGENNFEGCDNLKEIIIDCEIIKSSWFQDNTIIESIILGPNVKIIESNAFAGCTSLHYIHISQSLKFIGENAFEGCENLKNIDVFDINSWCNIDFENINSNPLSINNGVLFINGEEANDIKISGKTKAIKKNAFYGCSNIVMVTLYNGVECIEENAFYRCSNLLSVTIPSSVKNIKNGAFGECSNLGFMSFPNKEDNIITLDLNCAIDTTPWYQSWIRKNRHDGLLYLESWLVKHVGLIPEKSSVEVREGTNIIMEGAFLYEDGENFTGQPNLININLPTSLEYIKSYAFYNCSNLTEVHISSLEAWCNIDFKDNYANPLYYAKNLYINGELVTELVIPNSMTTIKQYAFYNCGLTSINIPESVTEIGYDAFYGCSNLVGVYINSIKDWCNITFGNEYSNPLFSSNKLFLSGELIEDLNIPMGVTKLKDHVFAGNKFKSITLLKTLTSLGVNSFGRSVMESEYESTTCYAVNPPQITDTSFYITHIKKPLYVLNQSVEKYKTTEFWNDFFDILPIPIIDEGICGNNITWILYEGGVLMIEGTGNMYDYGHGGTPWYEYYESIKTVIISDGVTSIGNFAFEDCGNLTSITVPESVMSIGNYAFSDCYDLTSINIPEGVTSIGKSAFDWCTSLTSITLPEGITSIGSSTFNSCHSLTSINIPDSVTSIGDYAFTTCISLNSITIGSGVTSIKTYAFAGCKILTSITIPESVTSIGNNAFDSCSGLTSITCHAMTPPTIGGSYTFNKVTKSIPVYVPAGSVEAYKKASYWRTFTNIQPISE